MRASIILTSLFFATQLLAAPQIQNWETSKGTRVFFVESHELPMVDIQLIFDAGSTRDPKDKNGLALLTNSLLSQGAAEKNADDISYEFESLGAVFSTDAGYDSALLSLRSLSEEKKLRAALDNFKQVVSRPDFPEAALERQRRQLLVGIQQKKQSPGAIASDAFSSAVFQQHPYAKPSEGTEETVKSLLRQDIVAFYQRYYVSQNAMLVIVGDMDRKKAVALAEDLLNTLPLGEKPQPLASVKPLKKAKLVKHDHPSAQMHILFGQPGVKRGDVDYFPLYVGNHILGGSGLVSLLFKEVREKRGLSYSAYSYFSPRRHLGPFVAGLQTRADQADTALQVLKNTISDFIDKGPSKKQLIAAKQNITGGFPLRLDSNSKILGYVAMIGFYGLPLDYLDKFNAEVESVTVEQIRDAFQRRVHPDKMVTVMVGPTATQKELSN